MEYDRRTVYVKGVSFDMHESQFEEAFSEVGPIRKAFLIRSRGHERHMGSGIVQFALPEDASKAVKDYNGKVLMGRQVEVAPAAKRAPLAERKQKRKDNEAATDIADALEPPQKKANSTKGTVMDDKQKALRTIALGNLSAGTISKAIGMAKAMNEVEEVIQYVSPAVEEEAKLRQDGCAKQIVLLTFKTVKAAVEAVAKLHGVSVGSGKQEMTNETALWARQLKGEGAMVKRWRLILRNLPFNVREIDVQSHLAPAGFVWEVTIPRKEDGSSKGFAFASFTSKAHAEKAIKIANGKKIRGRITAVDWAVSKNTFETNAGSALEGDVPGSSKDEDGIEFREDEGFSTEADVDPGTERDLMKRMAREIADDNDGGDEGSDPSKASAFKTVKPTSDAQTERQKRADTAGAGPSSSKANSTGAVRPLHGIIGRTVFVRGLGLEVSKLQLQARLESFGAVRACRLVLHPETKKPKGTAFVEFEDPSTALKAAQASARGRSGEGPGVIVGGATVEIDVAVTQEDARAMASAKAGKAGKTGPQDKRNLYLAKEGFIEEGSAIWQEMSKGDQEKRTRAHKEKTTKLRSPNFCISTTRLSLRNLPYTIDEKALKSLLISAVKERASKALPALKQVKILRDPLKKDKKGNPQSKGIAFAEFGDHEHALCALRQLNNNPKPFGKDRRPIIEFAVDNAQTMKAREKRESIRKGNAHKKNLLREAGEGPETTPKAGSSKKRQKEGKQTDKEQNGQGNPSKRARKTIEDPIHGVELSQSSMAKEQPRLRVRKKENKESKNFKQKESSIVKQGKVFAKTAETAAGHPSSSVQRGEERAKGTRKGSVKSAGKREKAPTKQEKGDKLDSLIANYRKTLFGGPNNNDKEAPKSSLKRWFE